MSIYAGEKSYKGYTVLFWLTPKTIKATIWQNTRLIKKLWTTKGYKELRQRVIKYLDQYDNNS